MIEPNACRDLIPKNLFKRWDKALCKSLFVSSKKVYCPYVNCSALLVVDDDVKVTETECPSFQRLFCAKYKVTWHAGIECIEFQTLGNTSNSNDEDAMLIQMAEMNQWRRCSRCKFYVEKVVGCMHIKCRCGFQFCYACGSKWSYRHLCSRYLDY